MKSTNRARRSAFTLIELLTVIAIIAVLAAIIFPVFGAVRENARRASCMTNMQQLATALKTYELDNRKYPDFLLTPALKKFNGASGEKTLLNNSSDCAVIDSQTNATTNEKLIIAGAGDEACTLDNASATNKLGGEVYAASGGGTFTLVGVGSLYPEYAKSLSSFRCPNNSWYDTSGSVGYGVAPTAKDYPVTAPITRYNAATVSPTVADRADTNDVRFYRFDSYDANPQFIKNGSAPVSRIQAAEGVWGLRYARQWMPTQTSTQNLSALPAANQSFYDKQLLWREPSADTYVTMCSYHGLSGKVLVMTLGGTGKVLDNKVLGDKGNPVTYSGTDFDTFRLIP